MLDEPGSSGFLRRYGVWTWFAVTARRAIFDGTRALTSGSADEA